jgi:predicted component of type VI protein secretion system
MTRKSLAKPKLTDAERHNHFVATAQEVGASDAKDFEKAFQKAFKNAFEKIACRKDATRRRTS